MLVIKAEHVGGIRLENGVERRFVVHAGPHSGTTLIDGRFDLDALAAINTDTIHDVGTVTPRSSGALLKVAVDNQICFLRHRGQNNTRNSAGDQQSHCQHTGQPLSHT